MRNHASLWAAVALLVLATPTLAQDIDDLDEGVVMEAPFVPGIEEDVWELGFQAGYLSLNHTLLQADGILVDLENPGEAIFADMELTGEVSFSPQIKLNRTFGKHWVMENAAGFAIGNFTQSLTSEVERWRDPNDVENFVSETELERGSLFSFLHEHSLVWYAKGEGRVLPFVTAGVGSQTFFLDSTYVDGGTTSFAFSYGVGLRVVGDDLYSLRLEIRNYHMNVQYDVSQKFATVQNLTGDGLVNFPVSRLVDGSTLSAEERARIAAQLQIPEGFEETQRIPVPYEGYQEESYSNLWISLGFVAAF